MNTPDAAVTRRSALKAGAAGTAVAATASLLPQLSPGAASADDITDAAASHQVFQHGVASGDPYPDSVILWTRVTSHSADIPGSEVGQPVALHWEVAAADDFTTVVTQGDIWSEPGRDNTVRVEAAGLAPYTRYAYRFTVTAGPHAGQRSTIGHTQTAPAPDADIERLRIALFSCAKWEIGWFIAYRDMAARGDIDLAMHVGDYIYEGGGASELRANIPDHEIITLSDYRLRYGTYRTDPDLQAAHAAVAWMVTWDDHEVANDSWAEGADGHQSGTEGDYRARRDNAIQAYLEWLPVRAVTFSEGGHLYRGARFGQLADVSMLDLRTYRTQTPTYSTLRAVDDPANTIVGAEQFQWLADRLTSSDTHWNIIGNSVMIAPLLIPPLEPRTTKALTGLLGIPEQGLSYNLDKWDGFAADRRRLFDLLRAQGQVNTVFLTGDVHTSYGLDLPYNPANYPGEGIVGVEVVGTSVTSNNVDDKLGLPQGNPVSRAAEVALSAVNHHVRFVDLDWHGYCVVQFEPAQMSVDWVWADDRKTQDSGVFVGKSMQAVRGVGLVDAPAPLDPAGHVPGRRS